MRWDDREVSAALAIDSKFPDSRSEEFSGISIDTRTIKPNEIFVAMQGTSMNGHHFLQEAAEKGARALITERTKDIPQGMHIWKVPSTTEALVQMAIYARASVPQSVGVLGLTGSVGKTTVKEGLRHALSAIGSVYASPGNHNNHLGTPLALCNMPDDLDWAIFEMGMNHAGELSHLSDIIKPDIAMVINVYENHIGHFDRPEDIAYAKAEIYASARTCIAFRDSLHYEILEKKALGCDNWITFGAHPNSDILLESTFVSDGKVTVKVDAAGTKLSYVLPALGAHWNMNSLAILSGCYALGADLHRSCAALSDFFPISGRGKQHYLAGSVMVIDDSYNAGPASVAAGIESLLLMPARRRIAVLGEMRELGQYTEAMIQNLLPLLKRLDGVFLCGSSLKQIYHDLPLGLGWAASSEDLWPLIKPCIREGDTFWIKGARTMKMEAILHHFITYLGPA